MPAKTKPRGKKFGAVRSDVPEFTRPNNATPYTALDAVSNSTSAPAALVFPNVARQGDGTGFVTRAILFTTQIACTARFRLHLYSSAPTPINDNAAGTMPLYADSGSYVGFIDFPNLNPPGTGGTAAVAQAEQVNLQIGVGGNPRVLYGLLQALDGFTPDAQQKFKITLWVDSN